MFKHTRQHTYKKIKKLWKKADKKDYYDIAKRIGSNIEKGSRRGAEYIYCWKKISFQQPKTT